MAERVDETIDNDFNIDASAAIDDHIKGDMKNETDAIHLKPEDWETRVDAYDRSRGQALGRDFQEIIQSQNASKADYRENAFAAASNAAEVVAVIEGRKPLFHEGFGDLAQPYADTIRRYAPRGVTVEAFDGHVIAYRPELVSRILDADPGFYRPHGESISKAVRKAVMGDATGELMGYGSRYLLGKNTVSVTIRDGNMAVAGFHTPAATVYDFARARLEDYERYYGKELSLEIK